MTIRAFRFTILVLLAAMTLADCHASTLVAVAPVSGQRLVEIDPKTGIATNLVTLPSATIMDLAAWPGEPRAVWMLGFPINGSTSITKIDAYTGIVSYSATLPHAMEGLTIDPTDGQLYASTKTNDIYRFTRGSTNLELVGNAGVVAGTFRLAFNSAGQLFGASESTFYTINKSTAAALAVGTMNGVGSTSRFDFAFRPEDEKLYAVGSYAFVGYALFTIDPTNGSTSPIGLSVVRPGGMAFLGVPEPSAFLLCCVGSLCLMRRRLPTRRCIA
jgi:hypothetical protein